METKYKITIPKPCHEAWDKMTATETGRFCASCTKSVVDFTGMDQDQVQHYFVANSDQKVCGRFKPEQLNTLTIRIPEQLLFSQASFHSIFLLALLIAMGTTLFSCSDKNGEKQKIDNVEVVKNDPADEQRTMGMILPKNTDPILMPPPAPKIDEVQFVKLPKKHKVTGNIKKNDTASYPQITGEIAIVRDSVVK